MALVLGLVMGVLFACCRYHDEVDQFTDYTYWMQGDELAVVKKREEVVEVVQPVVVGEITI